MLIFFQTFPKSPENSGANLEKYSYDGKILGTNVNYGCGCPETLDFSMFRGSQNG